MRAATAEFEIEVTTFVVLLVSVTLSARSNQFDFGHVGKQQSIVGSRGHKRQVKEEEKIYSCLSFVAARFGLLVGEGKRL